MSVKFENSDIVLLSAFRYALPRKSSVPGIIADEIIENWSELKPYYQDLIKREIGEVIEDSHLDECDIYSWSRILKL